MEPDVKQEQQQAEEDEQQQQEPVAEPAEVKQEVKAEEDAADNGVGASREVSDDELREKLLQMLHESDLSTVTGGEAVASSIIASVYQPAHETISLAAFREDAA
jgi:hypothetical protein